MKISCFCGIMLLFGFSLLTACGGKSKDAPAGTSEKSRPAQKIDVPFISKLWKLERCVDIQTGPYSADSIKRYFRFTNDGTFTLLTILFNGAGCIAPSTGYYDLGQYAVSAFDKNFGSIDIDLLFVDRGLIALGQGGQRFLGERCFRYSSSIQLGQRISNFDCTGEVSFSSDYSNYRRLKYYSDDDIRTIGSDLDANVRYTSKNERGDVLPSIEDRWIAVSNEEAARLGTEI